MSRANVRPVYMPMRIVAKALGVTTDTARKWCIRERCAKQRGRWWYTTREQFIAAFPEAARNLSV